jgi:hypothetical protein
MKWTTTLKRISSQQQKIYHQTRYCLAVKKAATKKSAAKKAPSKMAAKKASAKKTAKK